MFSRVDNGFGEMREEFRAVRTEIATLNRHLVQLTFSLVATVFLGFLGTITAILTQT